MSESVAELLKDWDAELRERGIWTNGHRIAARMARHLRAALDGSEAGPTRAAHVPAPPAPTAEQWCGQPAEGEHGHFVYCTLEKGHPGDHIAAIGPYREGEAILKQWPAKQP